VTQTGPALVKRMWLHFLCNAVLVRVSLDRVLCGSCLVSHTAIYPPTALATEGQVSHRPETMEKPGWLPTSFLEPTEYSYQCGQLSSTGRLGDTTI
jgi:hypothetical protein